MSLFTYQTLKSNPTSCLCEIHLNTRDDVFKGHFPATPILPGVYYLEIISAILNEQLSKNITFKSASNIKFLAPILAENTQKFQLSIQWKQEDSQLSINAIAQNETVIFSKLKCQYELS